MATYEKRVHKLLKAAGFRVVRNPRGSHVIWGKDGHGVSVPAKIKSRATANKILKEAGLIHKV